MHTRMVLFAAAALAFGGQAMADGFNYNYIQGDVISSELRGGGSSTSGDGLGAGASVELGSSWTTFFGVERTKYSEAGETIKFTPTSVGIGFHAPLASTLDFVGTASYERVRLSATGVGTGTETGWGLGAGLRGRVGGKFQWNGGIRYRDVGQLQSMLGIAVGGRYYVTPALGVGLEFSSDKFDKDVFGISVKENKAVLDLRYEFNRGG